MAGAHPALPAEIADFLVAQERSAALEAFVSALPASALDNERVHLARARVAAATGDLATLERLLQRRFATIREGERLLGELWRALQHGRLGETLGREPTPAELAAAKAGNACCRPCRRRRARRATTAGCRVRY